MPHLGFYHDDSIYWVSAKSLARGMDIVLPACRASLIKPSIRRSTPRCWPASGKSIRTFPPICRSRRCSPGCCFPFIWRWSGCSFDSTDSAGASSAFLVLMAGLSPVAAMFSFSLMPELLFTALLLASVMLAERALAGCSALVAGACRHLRGLGVSREILRRAAVVDGPCCISLWRKQFRKPRCSLPRCCRRSVGWQWWVARHLSHSWDLVTLYYTNYFGFQIYNVPAARPAAGDLAQPGWFPAGRGEAADLRRAVWRESFGTRGGCRRHRRHAFAWRGDAEAAISVGRSGNVGAFCWSGTSCRISASFFRSIRFC